MGQLKGYSSWCVHQAFPAQAERFAWQGGYGVVSFGTRDLTWVVHYIERRKEHHAKGTIIERLETRTPIKTVIPPQKSAEPTAADDSIEGT